MRSLAIAATLFVTSSAVADPMPPAAVALVEPPPVAPVAPVAPAAAPSDPPHWVRLAIATVAVFGIGEAWYWRSGPGTNSTDFSLPGNVDALAAKLGGGGWRYDGDGWATNAIKHPVFGATMYAVARDARLGVGAAFLASTGASLLWETVGEWREFGSINDMLCTSPAGLALGEFAHQLLHHPRAAHVELAVGGGSPALGAYGARAQVEIARTDATLAIRFDDLGTRTHDFAARAALVDLARGDTWRVSGASAYDYHRTLDRAPGEAWDLIGLAEAGVRAEIDDRVDDVQLHGELFVAGDFAMIRSQAFAAWRADHPDAIVRSSLQDNLHGYYYGLGATADARVRAAYRGIELGGSASASIVHSLGGRAHDRARDTITTDFALVDRDAHVTATIAYAYRHALARLELAQRWRSGEIDATHGAARERDALFAMGVTW